jgi:Domain of unknown function (DUF4390)
MRCARVFNGANRMARAAALGLALWALATLALAQAAPAFGVRTAYVQLVDGVYLLNARLHLPLNESMRAAINDGVALTLELEIEVGGARRYWIDDTVASLVQRYELQYHAVSDRYLVRNLNSGEQNSFAALDTAVEQLTHISGLPVLDQALIRKDRRYEFSIRATFDLGGMPTALRILLFWVDDFHRVSEWYTWPLLH